MQLILGYQTAYLKKMLEMFALVSQTCDTSHEHVAHGTLKIH